jgi:hypothetical protein
MVIYLVVGTCGEYEDRATWSVAAYRDEGRANLHAQKANDASAEWFGLGVKARSETMTRAGFRPFSYDTVRGLSVYDADTQGYSVVKVQLLDEVP